MNQYRPVILLASERSGTNLLRALLDTHSIISSPPPSGMIEVLPNIAHRYLLPSKPSLVDKLIEDVVSLTKIHMSPWDVDISVEMVSSGLVDTSFWGVFRKINELYAEEKGARCWFSKEPGLFRHAYALLAHIPDAKFIYMVRDGRDVASSMLELGRHESHIYSAARRWSSEQQYCLSLFSDPKLSRQVLMLKYEDLVASAEVELTRIMDFIGLELEPEQLEYYEDDRTQRYAESSVFWRNLSNPINTSSKGKYRDSLSKRQISVFESVAWMEMRDLDYELQCSERMALSKYRVLEFRISELIKKLFVKNGVDSKEKRMRQLRREKIQSIVNGDVWK